MAAKSEAISEIFYFGTPVHKHYHGEVARLLAKGIRNQRLGEFASDTHKKSQPSRWT